MRQNPVPNHGPQRPVRYAKLFALHRTMPDPDAQSDFRPVRVVSPHFAKRFQDAAIASLMAPRDITRAETED